MSVVTTSGALVDMLRKSGLFPPGALGHLLTPVFEQGPLPPSAEEFADRLVSAGILTRFQVRHVLEGKWKSLMLGEKYKLVDSLGRGATGRVYLAEHILLGRRVALKVLRKECTENTEAVERFLREARVLAGVDHPNIVRVHDIDRFERLYVLVMEFVDGINLHHLVRQGALRVGVAAHYAGQTAAGLQHASEAGLVHRDVKPGNLIVDRGGVVKLLDMGMARLLESRHPGAQQEEEGSVMGTADFIAPEQSLDATTVDIRADIYSLGASLYYLLTGKTPFGEGTTTQKLMRHHMAEPESVCEVRPEVPRGLAAVLKRMMAKEPSKRYQTPAEVMAALAPFAHGANPVPPAELFSTRGPSSAPTLLSQTTFTATAAHPSLLAPARPDPDEPPARTPPSRGLLVACGAGLVAIGLALGATCSNLFANRPQPTPPGDPPKIEEPQPEVKPPNGSRPGTRPPRPGGNGTGQK